jgi:hypothetical protein
LYDILAFVEPMHEEDDIPEGCALFTLLPQPTSCIPSFFRSRRGYSTTWAGESSTRPARPRTSSTYVRRTTDRGDAPTRQPVSFSRQRIACGEPCLTSGACHLGDRDRSKAGSKKTSVRVRDQDQRLRCSRADIHPHFPPT